MQRFTRQRTSKNPVEKLEVIINALHPEKIITELDAEGCSTVGNINVLRDRLLRFNKRVLGPEEVYWDKSVDERRPDTLPLTLRGLDLKIHHMGDVIAEKPVDSGRADQNKSRSDLSGSHPITPSAYDENGENLESITNTGNNEDDIRTEEILLMKGPPSFAYGERQSSTSSASITRNNLTFKRIGTKHSQ